MGRYLYARMNRLLMRVKFRVAGSGILIFVAVAMYIAMGSMIPGASLALEDKAEELRLSDLIVHVSSAGDSEAEELAGAEGVEEVDARLSISSRVSYATGDGQNESAPAVLIGIDAENGPGMNKPEVIAGESFSGDISATAILEVGFAQRKGIDVGERISLVTGSGPANLTVIGLAYSIEFGILPTNPQSILPLPGTLATVYLPIDWLRGSFDMPSDFVNEFLFLFRENVDRETTVNGITAALASSTILYVMERDQVPGYGLIKEDLRQGELFVGAGAGLVLLVAFFIIYSSFSRIVQEQRREIGVLGALGYSRGSIFLSYIYMAVVVGVISSLIGVILGYPFAYWATDFYVSEMMSSVPSAYVIPSDLIIGGMIFGPLTAALACGIATWSIVRMGPQEAMKGLSWGNGRRHRRRGSNRKRRSYLTLYTVRSMSRQRVRTALMVLAIGFSVAMGSMSFLFISSFNNSIEYSVQHGERWDMAVDYSYPINETIALSIVSDSITDRVQVSRLIANRIDSGEDESVMVIGMESSQTLHGFAVKRGEVAQGTDEVMLAADWAAERSLDVGDEVIMRAAFGSRTLIVSAIVDEFLGQVFVDLEVIGDLAGERLMSGMYVKCVPDGIEEAKEDLEASPLVANAQLRDDMQSGMMDLVADFQDILFVFVLVSVSISAVAISNIVFVSVLERQGEYGQLRALGYSRREISRSVLTEIVLLVMIGTAVALPLVIGVVEAFGDAMRMIWPTYSTILYPEDWIAFGLTALIALALGLLASVPAIRYLNKIDVAKLVSGGRFG